MYIVKKVKKSKMSIKFGNRIMIEVPLGVSWQYKYMIIDTQQKNLIKILDALIGQLSGIKFYYEDLEEKATLERVENFKKETHLAYVMHPSYEPKFDFNFLEDVSSVSSFGAKEISKEHMITE